MTWYKQSDGFQRRALRWLFVRGDRDLPLPKPVRSRILVSKRLGIRRMVSKMRQFSPTLLGIGGVVIVFALVAVATAPGSYSPDSLGQLQQAQQGVYSDGHPPLMAGLWSLLLRLTGTAESLYWLHLGLLLSAFVMFA